MQWRLVDIAGDDDLFARYGWRIPVLQRADDEELGWPFDLEAAREFVRSAPGEAATS